MIYFVEILEGGEIEPGTIKIGYTARMASRLPQLEVRYGCQIQTLGVMAGSRTLEAVIHRIFHEERIGREELFRPSARLMKYISKNARRWTFEIERDKAFDQSRKLIFSGTAIAWLEAAAVEAGYEIEDNGIGKVIDRALLMFGEYLGMPTPFDADIPPEERALTPKYGVREEPTFVAEDVA